MTMLAKTLARTRSLPRRRALHLFGLLAALLVGFAGPSAAAASGASRQGNLVGEWDVRVTIYVQDPPLVERATFTFGADHKLETINAPQEGEPLPGEGIWQVDGRHAFAFWITHPHPDENGNTIGTTHALHLGKLYGHRFETTASAYIVMHDGASWIGPISVRTEGVRIRS